MKDKDEISSIEIRISADCPRGLLGTWLRDYEKICDAAKLFASNNKKKKRVHKKHNSRWIKAQKRWNRTHSKIAPYFSIAGIPEESESSMSSEEYDSCVKNPSRDV